jgi:hypothetical protein
MLYLLEDVAMARWKRILRATILGMAVSFLMRIQVEAMDLLHIAPQPHDDRPFMVQPLLKSVWSALGRGIWKAYSDIATRFGLRASGYSDTSTRFNLVA